MIHAQHWVARTLPDLAPVQTADACADLWQRLRRLFPQIGACVLMPNHIHVVSIGRLPSRTAWKLAVELRAWSRRFAKEPCWEPVPAPKPIADLSHLKRQIRYVHLNPCRDRLVNDPLKWEWSTHRDFMGMIHHPWPDLKLMASYFNCRLDRLAEVSHRYISSDPSVAVEGTDPPRMAPFDSLRNLAVERILAAVASAERRPPSKHRGLVRTRTLQILAHLKVADPHRAARDLAVSARTWRRSAETSPPPDLVRAVAMTLSDPRTRPTKNREVSSMSGSGSPMAGISTQWR